MKPLLKLITGIFYSGPYVWESKHPAGDAIKMIQELHQGGLTDNFFYPGISVKVKGQKFKVTRWGIGKLPMSGNSFVHILFGEVHDDGTKTLVKAYFRLSLVVLCFSIFWFSFAFLIAGGMAIVSAMTVLIDGDWSKLPGVFFGIGFPIVGTLMFLLFRGIAKPNEEEIMNGMRSKFGEPLSKPE